MRKLKGFLIVSAVVLASYVSTHGYEAVRGVTGLLKYDVSGAY